MLRSAALGIIFVRDLVHAYKFPGNLEAAW